MAVFQARKELLQGRSALKAYMEHIVRYVYVRDLHCRIAVDCFSIHFWDVLAVATISLLHFLAYFKVWMFVYYIIYLEYPALCVFPSFHATTVDQLPFTVNQDYRFPILLY